MEDILVTASEYSMLVALKNGIKNVKELHHRLGYTEDNCQSRIYYFVSSGWIERNHLKSGFKFLVPIERFVVYPNEIVKQFRMRNDQRPFKLHDTRHITPIQIDQIRKLTKLGYRRTDIAKRLQIKKSDLLMVLLEQNITSTNKPLTDDEADFNRGERLLRYKEAYLKARELRDIGFMNKDIADYLNKNNFKNMNNTPFLPNTIHKLLTRTPKILMEEINEIKNQEIAQ
jgi:hypothetical protein